MTDRDIYSRHIGSQMLGGGKMKGDAVSGGSSNISPMVSFLLGAAVATVCVLFFMSASPGRSLVDVAAWSHNNGTAAQHHHLRSVADDLDAARNLTVVAAPAPAPVQVRTQLGILLPTS